MQHRRTSAQPNIRLRVGLWAMCTPIRHQPHRSTRHRAEPAQSPTPAGVSFHTPPASGLAPLRRDVAPLPKTSAIEETHTRRPDWRRMPSSPWRWATAHHRGRNQQRCRTRPNGARTAVLRLEDGRPEEGRLSGVLATSGPDAVSVVRLFPWPGLKCPLLATRGSRPSG